MSDQTEATTTEAPAAEPAPAPVQRVRQNGFTRPIAGTKTGLIWDIADEISAREKRPAKRDEVFKEYQARVPDAMNGTMSTQYSRWCGFHKVSDVLRKMRADEKATANTEATAAAAAKAEATAKAKADKEAEKQKKAADAAAKKAEKAAAAKAKADAAAAAAAKAKADAEAAAAGQAQ
jgi:hypothetical protein